MPLPPARDLVYVGVQFALLLALAADPWPGAAAPSWAKYVGAAGVTTSVAFGLAAVLQLGTALTPWPSPRRSGALVTAGTYALVRHPIYAALLLFAASLALATWSPWRAGLALALYLLFCRKAAYEERLLRERYGDAYLAYAERVKGLCW